MAAKPAQPAPSAVSRKPRAALWLVGAAVLAGGVQAIFLLMPEPQSAGATESGAPEIVAALDSTAFTLEEDSTVLPGSERAGAADSLRRRAAFDSARAVVPAAAESAADTWAHPPDSSTVPTAPPAPVGPLPVRDSSAAPAE